VLFALSFEVGDPTKAIMLRLHNATDFGRLTASLADSPREWLRGKLHALGRVWLKYISAFLKIYPKST
jgi:hypothetical protein